jgi:molybdenum cofactor cytidylyltransferase
MFRSFAIVPAAGRSTRMGTDKRLLPWGGGTVVSQLLAVWRRSAVTRTVVVVGPNDRALAADLDVAAADVVVAPRQPVDMKASVLLGLDHVRDRYGPGAEDVWLVAPADMPGLLARVIDDLLAAHRPTTPRILVPMYGDRRGHPALFPWPLAAAVASLGDDEGIRGLFARHEVDALPFSAAAMPGDVDTPIDYSRQRSRQGQQGG